MVQEEGLRMSPWGRGGEMIQFVILFISIVNEMDCWERKNEDEGRDSVVGWLQVMNWSSLISALLDGT